jgi:enterochelin esterase-like enzyme
MSSIEGELVAATLAHDGGRGVTAYVPPERADAEVFAADGAWHTSGLAAALEAAELRSTMVVGVHGVDDDEGRLHEYVSSFGGARFDAFERFFVDDVRTWVRTELGVDLPASRTAAWGASLGGELALAMGLRHADLYGAVFCASPGGGFTPAAVELPRSLPRTYLVGGRQEQWFLDNATRWSDALRDAGEDVLLAERDGEHGGAFWHAELPRMVSWAFGG